MLEHDTELFIKGYLIFFVKTQLSDRQNTQPTEWMCLLALVLLVALHAGSSVGHCREYREKRRNLAPANAEQKNSETADYAPFYRVDTGTCDGTLCGVCVHLCTSVHMKTCVYVYTCMCTCVHVHTCIRLCVSVCVYMCVWCASLLYLSMSIACSHDEPVFPTTVAVPCRCSSQATNLDPRAPFAPTACDSMTVPQRSCDQQIWSTP